MIDLTKLPEEALHYISELRREATQMRWQRDGARDEAEALRAELAALKAV